MSDQDPFLVIGADGLLGGLLFRRWREQGREVFGTSRRSGPPGEGVVSLDLTGEMENWTPPFAGGVAVLCAANANQEQCRRDPAATGHLNVTQTLKLARRLLADDFFLVFLSSSVVFDGSKPGREPGEPLCPMTEYGRQKAAVEIVLSEFPERTAILRLGKVVHKDLPVFRSWREALLAGKAITPFSDYICSPISTRQTVDCVARIAEGRRPGVWHAMAQDDISYAEIARLLAVKNGFLDNMVRPKPAPPGLLEHLPKHASLDVSRTEAELNLVFPPSRQVIASL